MAAQGIEGVVPPPGPGGVGAEVVPEEEVVLVEEVAQVVAADLAVGGLVVADNPSEKYLN